MKKSGGFELIQNWLLSSVVVIPFFYPLFSFPTQFPRLRSAFVSLRSEKKIKENYPPCLHFLGFGTPFWPVITKKLKKDAKEPPPQKKKKKKSEIFKTEKKQFFAQMTYFGPIFNIFVKNKNFLQNFFHNSLRKTQLCFHTLIVVMERLQASDISFNI